MRIRKRLKIVFAFMFILTILSSASFSIFAVETDSGKENDDLNTNIDRIVDELDLTAIEQYLQELDEKQKGVFGNYSVKDRILLILSGEMQMNFGSFMGYIAEVVGINILQFLPMIISILVISIAYNTLNSVKGKLSSESVENVVHFVSISLVTIIVLAQIIAVLTQVLRLISSMQAQMNAVFPIILTMMAATGAIKSAAIYQPSIAILAGGVTEIVTLIILPFFILTTVFSVIGNISEGVKLKKMSGFFSSTSKWLLGTIFFVFLAFLSIQGITASVYDGVSVRTAKFMVSKYVPIIGGYLSEGLNLVMAGSVLIKNAVGMTAVILLFLTLVPVIVKVIIFSLSLSITGAIVEPLGNSKISSLMTELSKNVSTLVAIVLGTAFLYFIFLILVISTGNLVL